MEGTTEQAVTVGSVVLQPTTASQLLMMLESGNKNRTQHPTDANAESSRSHAVFQVMSRAVPVVNEICHCTRRQSCSASKLL